MRQTLYTALSFSLVLPFVLVNPVIAQEAEVAASPVAAEVVRQPERKLKLVTESVPGYIPKYSNSTGGLTESILLNEGGMLSVAGGIALWAGVFQLSSGEWR